MTLRPTPLRDLHVELGAKLVGFSGFELPLSYPAGTVAEHLACRRDAAVFDVSHLGSVVVEGRDAFSRLQGRLTNDLARIAPGSTQYHHLLDEEGSVLDDVIVWWLEPERFEVVANAANTALVAEALGGDDRTAERALVAVQGPHARERLAAVSPAAAGVLHNRVASFEYGGERCLAAGTGYTGEDGVECSLPPGLATRFFEELVRVGAQPAGLGARDTLRLEAGLPLHGHELGPGITPLQAGLAWVVAFDKGPFPGREALLDERSRGPRRLLRGILGEGRRPLRDGDEVVDDEGVARLGALTSGGYSPLLERGIGLGFVPPGVGLGTRVRVRSPRANLLATLVRPPFHRAAPSRLPSGAATSEEAAP